MSTSNRMYFLDNLRAAVILLVIVLHASVTYAAYAPQWWYVVDSQNSLFFSMLALLIDVPIMQVMFFLAGYFALPSLQRHGAGAFVKGKTLRIGLPWVVGVLFLTAPVAYLMIYSRNLPLGFWQFWGEQFWGPFYQQSVYWFLGVLCAMFLALALVYRLSARLQADRQRVETPSWLRLGGFIALMSACFFALNRVFSLDAWVPIWFVFVVQPPRVPLYIGYFVLGIYAQRRGWFTAGGYRPSVAPWVLIFLFSSLPYIAIQVWGYPPVAGNLIMAVLFNTACFSGLLAGVGIFQRWVNSAGRIWSSLARSSYAMYYFHPLIVYPLAYLLLGLSLNVYPKALLLISAGIGLTWAFAELVVRRVPGLRDVFYPGVPIRRSSAP